MDFLVLFWYIWGSQLVSDNPNNPNNPNKVTQKMSQPKKKSPSHLNNGLGQQLGGKTHLDVTICLHFVRNIEAKRDEILDGRDNCE
jgi:hypothetical protein